MALADTICRSNEALFCSLAITLTTLTFQRVAVSGIELYLASSFAHHYCLEFDGASHPRGIPGREVAYLQNVSAEDSTHCQPGQ